DADGKALLDTDPQLVGKKIEDRPDFSTLQTAGFRRKLRLIYHAPTVYDVHIPLLLNGEAFGSVHVGVSAVSVLCSLMLAALLSHIALGPLEHINRSLDSMAAADGNAIKEAEEGGD